MSNARKQITTKIDESLDPDLYVPIYPCKKDRRTNMQLKLCHDPLGLTGLPFRSYLRVHQLYEVPRSMLTERISGCNVQALELQVQSYKVLQHFLRMRGKISR